MKRFLGLLLGIYCSFWLSAQELDSTLYKKFDSLDIERFKGRKLKSLLKENLLKDFISYRYVDGSRIGSLAAVVLIYDHNTRIFIDLETPFKNLERDNPNRNWNFRQVKKERIKNLEILL